MTLSVAELHAVLHDLFNDTARQIASDTEFCRRQRLLTGPAFAKAVFSLLEKPDSSLEDFADFAFRNLEVFVTPKAFEERFTRAAASFLRDLFLEAFNRSFTARPALLPLLRRFNGVFLRDATLISLPAHLGPWEVDLVTNRVTTTNQILGLPGGCVPVRLEEYAALVHPDDAAARDAALDDVLAGRSSQYKAELRMRDGNGQWVWVYSCGQVIERDASGRPALMIGMAMDVTERKRAEEELRKANDRLALAVRGSQVSVWENDLAGGDYRTGRVHCTKVLEQLGYPAPDAAVSWEAVAASIHPDDRGPVEKALRAYLAGATEEYSVEFRARHGDGSYRWMRSRGVAVREAGRPVRFVGTRIDITELEEAEEALRESEARFRAFIDHATDAFFLNTWSPEARFVDVNCQACASLGVHTRQVDRHGPARHLPGRDPGYARRAAGAHRRRGDGHVRPSPQAEGRVHVSGRGPPPRDNPGRPSLRAGPDQRYYGPERR
jgi:PAS domain S-box-containing protein